MIPFPDKKYDIIYADPAWNYDNQMSVGNTWDKYNGVKNHYNTLSMTEIKNLPVADIVNTDCLLFLWVISPDLDECIGVGKAWGFKFSTVGFVWDKQRELPSNYTMSQCELCLIFKRGKIPKPRGKRNIRQFLSCKKGAHSVKPLEIKHRITEMFPTQSKIELFARPLPLLASQDDGWDYWGNEV